MRQEEIFKKVVEGLAKQGFRQSVKPSVFGLPTCSYRGVEGRKCAAGFLIPDEIYKPEFEGKNVLALQSVFEGLGFTKRQVEFLHQLQFLHDTCLCPVDMKDAFRWLAKRLKVKMPKALIEE